MIMQQRSSFPASGLADPRPHLPLPTPHAPPPKVRPMTRTPLLPSSSGFVNTGRPLNPAQCGLQSVASGTEFNSQISNSPYANSPIYNPPFGNPHLANLPFENSAMYTSPFSNAMGGQSPFMSPVMKMSPYANPSMMVPFVPNQTPPAQAAHPRSNSGAGAQVRKNNKHTTESKILFAELFRTLFTSDSPRKNFTLDDFESFKEKILTGYAEGNLSITERDLLYKHAEEKSLDLKVERDFEKGYPEMVTFHYFGRNNEDKPEEVKQDLEIICKDGVMTGNKEDLGTASSVFYNSFHPSINVVHCPDRTKRELKNFVLLISKGIVAVMKTRANEFHALLQSFKVRAIGVSGLSPSDTPYPPRLPLVDPPQVEGKHVKCRVCHNAVAAASYTQHWESYHCLLPRATACCDQALPTGYDLMLHRRSCHQGATGE